MKKILLFIIILCCFAFNVCAYDRYNPNTGSVSEAAVRRRAFNAPAYVSNNARRLTAYLVKPFDNNIDKLRVIAYWIASHIAYDGYKYNNGQGNMRNFGFHYDVFKARTGICSDFALLFQEMSLYAGIRNVKYVSGYVVTTTRLRSEYSNRLLGDGHAWNSVKIKGKTYYIDTTWMAPQKIVPQGRSNRTSLQHKFTIKRRVRSKLQTDVAKNINTYYFLFTPQDEVHKFGEHHYAVRSY